jgi:hypothetical protein
MSKLRNVIAATVLIGAATTGLFEWTKLAKDSASGLASATTPLCSFSYWSGTNYTGSNANWNVAPGQYQSAFGVGQPGMFSAKVTGCPVKVTNNTDGTGQGKILTTGPNGATAYYPSLPGAGNGQGWWVLLGCGPDSNGNNGTPNDCQ